MSGRTLGPLTAALPAPGLVDGRLVLPPDPQDLGPAPDDQHLTQGKVLALPGVRESVLPALGPVRVPDVHAVHHRALGGVLPVQAEDHT